MYKEGIYKGLDREEIRKKVEEEGFNPIVINDGPGRVYPPHTHPETKLLAILEGEMDVKTGGEEFALKEGDQLIIPGSQKHEAVVGDEGCMFFWSEKLV